MDLFSIFKGGKYFDKHIAPKCDYCQFGRRAKDGNKVLCEKRGLVNCNDSCNKFIYSPLKRIPVKQLNFVGSLADEDIYIESAGDRAEKEELENPKKKDDTKKDAKKPETPKQTEPPKTEAKAQEVTAPKPVEAPAEAISKQASVVENATPPAPAQPETPVAQIEPANASVPKVEPNGALAEMAALAQAAAMAADTNDQ